MGPAAPLAFAATTFDPTEQHTALERFVRASGTELDENEVREQVDTAMLTAPHVRAALLARSTDHVATWRAFDKPVAVFHGALDRVVPIATAELLSSIAPHARLERFDDVGHLVFREAPGRFDAALTRFVAP
jgi:pimeloyl-ACP methyl ester carboxylesterase